MQRGARRVDARLDIVVTRDHSRPTQTSSVSRRVYEAAPLRSFWPHREPGHPAATVLGNASGGVLGGDHLAYSIRAGRNAALTVTSQAAEKFYRAASLDEATLDVALTVDDGGWLEWLPKGSIVFDGARLRRATSIEVAATGRCLAGEVLVLGRVARGERWRRGLVRDRWSVRIDGRIAWVDAFHLDDARDDVDLLVHIPAALGGATTIATCVLVSPDAADWVEPAREALAAAPRARCGATALPGILIARVIGEQPIDVRTAWERCVSRLREAGGWPTSLPHVARV